MRPSNRSRILEAAIRVVQKDGVAAVTFDAVAAESGLTRGGMIYHFPSREALLLGIHEFLAEEWEASIIRHAGKSAKESSSSERLLAYLQACEQSASTADLQFYLEASASPIYAAPWRAVMSRWLGGEEKGGFSTDAMIVRLAADGLWIHDALSEKPVSKAKRAAIMRRLKEMIV